MTDGTKSKVEPDTEDSLRSKGRERTSPLNDIQTRLRQTEKVMRNLTEQLDYYKKQNSELMKERSTLLELISVKNTLKDTRTQLESDIRLIRSERDQLAEDLKRLDRENKEMKSRCARVEKELAAERKNHAEAKEVVVYLEAQIEQLESMVKMLDEHKLFMDEKEQS